MKKRFVLPLVSFLCLTGCNSQTSSFVLRAGKVIVEKEENRENLKIGETNQLSSHAYGNIKDEVKYESLTPDVLSVTDKGLVKALKEGSGRIKIYASEAENIYAIANYTVYASLRDTYAAMDAFLNKIESVNLENGASFNLSTKLDIGKVKASLSSSIKGDILDTSYSPETDKRISFPLLFETRQKKNQDKKDSFYHLSLQLGDMMDSLLENNTLLKLADQAVNLKGILYQEVLNLFDNSFKDYLNESDHRDLESIDLYNFGDINLYTAGKRDFSEDKTNIKPYCFSNSNLLDFLSPYAETIYEAYLNQSKEEEAKPGSLNYKELFSKDGMLVLMSFLKNYLIENKEGTKVTYSFNEKAVGLINTIYKDKIKNTTISYEENGFSLSFHLPEEIENIYLSIDNTSNFASFEIKGKRQGSIYPFLQLNLDSFEEINKNSMNSRIENVKGYIKASQDFDSLDDSLFFSEKTNVKKLIQEAKEIKRAELDYSADPTGKELMKKKNEFYSYYYNESISDDKRRDLLSVMMDALSKLDYSSQDEFFSYASKTSLADDEKASFTCNHFYKGKNVDDFKVSYQSSDEDVFSIDGTDILPHGAIYNGRVGLNNAKQVNNTSIVTLTASSKGLDSFTDSKSFSKTFTYTGDKKDFRKNSISFQSSPSFNSNTREMKVKPNSELDLNTILTLSQDQSVRYSSFDLRLASVSLLKNNLLRIYSPYEESLATEKRNLCGIKATITEGNDTEEIIFYIRIEE